MQYRSLGRTGVQVSALCYGAMSFGGDADEATSAALYARCRDAGINFFDCANVYGRGRAEEILGKLMAGHRDELVITSKVGFRMHEGVNGEGLNRRHILREVEESLRRLGTDRIDVYFCHRFDPATPMEETLAALDTLVQQGKILYPAVSNWAAWQIASAGAECAASLGALRRAAADVQPGQAPGRGGTAAAGAGCRAGRDSLQPAGRRLAHRQVWRRSTPGGGTAGGKCDVPEALRRRSNITSWRNASPSMHGRTAIIRRRWPWRG
jgi:hypothetical protein